MVTLGCARNDVDSDELAGRLLADGWTVVDDPDDAAILQSTQYRAAQCRNAHRFAA